MSNAQSSRRQFLRQATAFAGLGAGAPFALNMAAVGSAAAQSTASDYKALVCVFLHGGNDAYNTVLATDSPSWNAYVATRNQQPTSIALNPATLRPLSPTQGLASSRSLALHPQLPGLQRLFNDQRKLAIVSNVGPLVEPLSKDDFFRQQKRVPSRLYSHNDQQATWQALGPEGSALGWGGKLADIVGSGNQNSLFTGVSVAGNAVWVSGQNVRQYQMQPNGVLRMAVSKNQNGVDMLFGSSKVASSLQKIATNSYNGHPFEKDLGSINARSIEADRILDGVLPSTTASPFGPSSLLTYARPDGTGMAVNPLAQQLQAVARTIAARNTLGMRRQVFFVSLGGFDTHDGQLARHADLMARLDHAMVYFDTVLTSMGLSDEVVTFTASDFGRSFTSNGDGTDHGWGSHHFVMGGAVQGGTVAGEFPTYSNKNANNNNFDNSPDQITNGTLLPKVAVEQYGAALGSWFGAGSAISSIFPNLGNFGGPLNFLKS